MTDAQRSPAAGALTEEIVRSELARILAPRRAHADPVEMGIGSDDSEPARAYLAAMRPGGWALPSWPRRFGGRDADASEKALIERVRDEFEIPDLYIHMIGLHMAGPALLDVGTDEQREQWLPGISDGSEIWCQLFSEPEAGSDLANLALRAERDGDVWRLQGQKVWVSRATWARWGLVITRTAPHLPKHKGLTTFVVDMRDPRIEVRPLRQMNNDEHFSEVFFDDVEIPDSWRLGEENRGWDVAMTLLARERTIAGKVVLTAWNDIPLWLRACFADGAVRTAAQRDHAMRVIVHGAVATLAASIDASRSSQSGAGGSVDKLRRSALFKAQANLRVELLGASAMLSDSPGYLSFVTSPSMSIRGGTDEIQRNIVGERLLGLGAEPRLDRDVPWSESRRGIVT